MRIERIRKLIWGVDFLVALGAIGCLWLFFISPASALTYDQPDSWKRRGGARGTSDIELPQTEAWSSYGRLLVFPKDGLRPPPPDPEIPGGPALEKGAVSRLGKLISYRRITLGTDGPSTDESRVTLELLRTPGKTVDLAIGENIPDSVWMFVDLEKGLAIFKNTADDDAKVDTLEYKGKEIALPGEYVAPADGGPRPGAAGGGPAPGAIQPGLDAVEFSPGKFNLGPREEAYLGDESRVEEIRRSISAAPWKNPETQKYEGLKIRKVKENSYLSKRGVKSEDVLISINGVPVSSKDQVINYVRGPGKDQKQYVLKMLRNGQPIERVYNRKK